MVPTSIADADHRQLLPSGQKIAENSYVIFTQFTAFVEINKRSIIISYTHKHSVRNMHECNHLLLILTRKFRLMKYCTLKKY